MRFSRNGRRLLASVGALLGVLALGGATVAWGASGAAPLPPRAVVATADVIEESIPSITSSSTSTSSTPTPTPTSTSTSTSTSTTLKPRPAAATTRATSASPVAAPPVAQPPPMVQHKNNDPAERCANARQWVAAQGLALPAGWGFRCPGSAVLGGGPRWGLACWNCEGNGSSWIAVDVGRIGASDVILRHVIAHETCHAIEYTTLGLTTELTADLCAALHGAPRP